MARPRKCRRVCCMPENIEFSPVNMKQCNSECVILKVEEYETFRLIDHVGMTQEQCAAQMEIARTTVQSIYDTAKKKIADAIVNGKRLRIEGGDYKLCEGNHEGEGCVFHCKRHCRKRSPITDIVDEGGH